MVSTVFRKDNEKSDEMRKLDKKLMKGTTGWSICK
jgi:hypothetical protein